MKKFAAFLMPFATLCLLGTLGIQGLALLVAALSSDNIGHGLPLRFFEQIGLPILSVALPVLGMLLFTLCLPALRRGTSDAEPHFENLLIKHPSHSVHEPDQHHLKAA